MTTTLEQIAKSLETLARDELWNSPGVASGETKGRYEALRQAARIVRENEETEEQRRKRFEAWLSIKFDVVALNWPLDFSRRADGGYRSEWIESHWQAWQASQTFTEDSQ